MPTTGYSPAPGERRTIIVLWEIDDPEKAGDPRYWWDEEESARMRTVAARLPDLAGKPKGQPLASLLARAEGDNVEWVFPGVPGLGEEHHVLVSLAPWRDADPDRTYLIVSHHHAPAPAEQAAIGAKRSFPPEVEAMRLQLVAAVAADDDDRAAELRRRLETSAREHGLFKRSAFSPWNPDRATEVQPGVFVQDERPRPIGG